MSPFSNRYSKKGIVTQQLHWLQTHCKINHLNQYLNDGFKFISTQCGSYAKLSFVVYRLLVAAYFVVFLVVHLSTAMAGVSGLKIFIYLSDWTLILTTLYVIVAFLNAVADYAYYHRYGMYLSDYSDGKICSAMQHAGICLNHV